MAQIKYILLFLFPFVLNAQETIKIKRNDTIYFSNTQVFQQGRINLSDVPAPHENLVSYWGGGFNADSTFTFRNIAGDSTAYGKLYNVDFPLSLRYIPLKTASTYRIFTASTNDTSITNHELYPTTQFSNGNYDSTLYTQIKDHVLNADSTELYPARIPEIALYSQATDANSYFGVPALAKTGVRWVGPGETYTTIVAAEAAAATNDTIYIKSGTYTENNATSKGIRPIKAVTWIALGNVEVRASATANYVCDITASSTNAIKFKGVIFNAQDTYSEAMYGASVSNKTFDNCIFKNATTYIVDISTASGSGFTFNNCGFLGATSASAILGMGYNIYGSFFKVDCANVLYNLNSAGIYNVMWNRFVSLSDTRIFWHRSNGTYNIKYNSFDIMDAMGDNVIESYAGAFTGNIRYKGNTFNINNAFNKQIIEIQGTAVHDVDFVSNDFVFNKQYDSQTGIIINDQVSPYLYDNYFYSDTANGFTYIDIVNSTATAKGTPWATANSFDIKNKNGYCIKVGSENSGTGDNTMTPIIEKNKIIGPLHYDPSASSVLGHALFVGFNKNATLRYNYVDGAGIHLIAKGSTGTVYDSCGIYGNVSINGIQNIRVKGASNVPIYNNTVYNNLPQGAYGLFVTQNLTDFGGAIVKNNIIQSVYSTARKYIINIDAASASHVASDTNRIYYTTGDFIQIGGADKTFSEYQGLGYDVHTLNQNPNFVSTSNLWPLTTITGTNLGTKYNKGLDISTVWPTVVTKQQGATWQIGAYVK